MNDNQIGLARHRMQKARSFLEDARILFENRRHNATANRAYYAAFHAVRALLALKKLDSSKHAGVISLFNREYVKTGMVPKNAGRILQRLFDARIEGDYRDLVTVEETQAKELLEMSSKMLSDVSSLLDRLISYRSPACIEPEQADSPKKNGSQQE